MSDARLSTNFGAPLGDNDNSLTAGPRGPVLLQDFQLIEKLAHFDRERIPERVVHAKGAGAHGFFEVTHDLSKWTRAHVFGSVGRRPRRWRASRPWAAPEGRADRPVHAVRALRQRRAPPARAARRRLRAGRAALPLLGQQDREHLIANLAGHLAQARTSVQQAMVEHFRRADPDYGARVAAGLAKARGSR